MYNAEIVGGSLLINETRKLAQVMLLDDSIPAWQEAVIVDNVLQKKTQATAKRMANLIRNRLETGDKNLWHLIVAGDFELAGQAILVLAIRHSRLLADFMSEVVGLHVRRLDFQLTKKDWDDFLQECELRSSKVDVWSDTTREKLFQVVLRILAEAKYINSTKEKIIQSVMIRPEIRAYLDTCKDHSTLASLELHQ